MRLTIASAFRDAERNAHLYLSRIGMLRDLLGSEWHVRVIAGEGDSVDHTRMALISHARALGIELVFAECAHGGPRWGSTEEPERLKALSFVLNQILEKHAQDSEGYFIYVEQDLKWDPQTLRELVYRVIYDERAEVFAPLVMAGQCFYDTWGFRLDSRESRFGPHFPYCHKLLHQSGEVLNVYSVGSCLAMDGKHAASIRVSNDYALVGWCEAAREAGLKIGVCSDLIVRQA